MHTRPKIAIDPEMSFEHTGAQSPTHRSVGSSAAAAIDVQYSNALEAPSAQAMLGARHEGTELRHPFVIAGGQLSIEVHRVSWQLSHGLSNGTKAFGDVFSALAVDGGGAISDLKLCSPAICFTSVGGSRFRTGQMG